MKLSKNIKLYGNTNMNKILAHKDIELFKYIKKIELINQPIQLDILRDNNGDYWLIGLEYLGNGDFSAIIPNFIYGITSIINITKAYIDDDRFRFNYIQNKEISDIELNYQKSIIGYNAGGKLTVKGSLVPGVL